MYFVFGGVDICILYTHTYIRLCVLCFFNCRPANIMTNSSRKDKQLQRKSHSGQQSFAQPFTYIGCDRRVVKYIYDSQLFVFVLAMHITRLYELQFYRRQIQDILQITC